MTDRQPPETALDVEVRPEVVFLSELLEELISGRIRVPRFQRPFVWRNDQMTDLLDSVYKQYPIGSLLVWETEQQVATLSELGPFRFPRAADGRTGYLLDGHQRLSTLAAALIPRSRHELSSDYSHSRWDLVWNIRSRQFQHRGRDTDELTFDLTSLLDTVRFLADVDKLRGLAGSADTADGYVTEISRLARAFQHYRVPVIRIRKTGLSEAVEIFARLNSKGQAMSADQMVSALMYRPGQDATTFDLAQEIDNLQELLGSHSFADIDRTTVLRAILANLGEDIYRTDWTALTSERRDDLFPRLREGVHRTRSSLEKSVAFLNDLGVRTSRLLPYSTQIVLLSAFYDAQPSPTQQQLRFLQRWFWVSSFSAWFGTANPSRINSLVVEFRRDAAGTTEPHDLQNFDMEARALPYPTSFDMRSARTRALLAVLLNETPRDVRGAIVEEPWRDLAEKGPDAVGRVLPASSLPREWVSNPANRIFSSRTGVAAGASAKSWVLDLAKGEKWDVLDSHVISRAAAESLLQGDQQGFLENREASLIASEARFLASVGVPVSSERRGESSLDTE